jgi:hypothetical protein
MNNVISLADFRLRKAQKDFFEHKASQADVDRAMVLVSAQTEADVLDAQVDALFVDAQRDADIGWGIEQELSNP